MSIAWPDVDRRQEAAGDDAAKDLQRAARAGADILADQRGADKAAIAKVADYLNDLKRALTARLLGGQGLSSFKRTSLQNLLEDTDRLIRETQKRLVDFAGDAIEASGDLGVTYATAPIEASGLTIQARLPGLDEALVTSTFRATASLLSPPMRQYADEVKRSIRRVALAGESQFDEMRRLANVIDDRGDVAMFKAERIIRTEVGRVFNEATYARALALAKEFPFIRKGWRAAGDNRTRRGHREAGAVYSRGDGLIPFNQAFKIRVYDERPGKPVKLLGSASLRFPIDPEAAPAGRLAAAATIMCRCNAFIDFDPKEYREFTKKRLTAILNTDPAPPPPPPPPPVTPTPPPAPAPPAVVPDTTIAPKPKVEPKAVRERLQAIDKSDDAVLSRRYEKRRQERRDRYYDLDSQLSSLEVKLRRELAPDIEPELAGLKGGDYYEKRKQLIDQRMQRNPEWAKLKAEADQAKKLYAEWSARAKAAKDALMERVRSEVWADLSGRPKLRPVFERGDTGSVFGGELQKELLVGVDAFEKLTTLAPRNNVVGIVPFNGRSNAGRDMIRMGTQEVDVVVHELSHVLEYQNPYVHEQAVAFLVRRTAGQQPAKLSDLEGKDYEDNEIATKDGFDRTYAGKWYTQKMNGLKDRLIETKEELLQWIDATEIVSMGMQRMYQDPVEFQAADPEYFDFIFKLARGEATESLPDDPAGWNHVHGVIPQKSKKGKAKK